MTSEDDFFIHICVMIKFINWAAKGGTVFGPVYTRNTCITDPRSSSETQGQSVRSGENAQQKFSNYFQKFKRMPSPDWAQKMLCIIVPNRQTVSPEFFSWVHTRLLLSSHTCPACSPSLCVQGKLLFSTFLTRNKGTTDESKKCLGCYPQEQLNLPREYSVSDGPQSIYCK